MFLVFFFWHLSCPVSSDLSESMIWWNLWFLPNINLGEILRHHCFKYFFCSFLSSPSGISITHAICNSSTVFGYSVLCFPQVFFLCFLFWVVSHFGLFLLRYSQAYKFFLGHFQFTDKPIKGIPHFCYCVLDLLHFFLFFP